MGPQTRVGVYSDLGRYGAGRAMATIASGLSTQGVRVEVVTFNKKAFEHPLRDPRWGPTVLPADGIRGAALLWCHLRRTRPSAVILADRRFAAAAVLVARLAGPGSRLIVVLHSDPQRFLTSGSHMSPGRLALWRLFLGLAFRCANHVVTVSEAMRRNAQVWLRLHPSQLVTIGNPVLSREMNAAALAPTGCPWLDDPDRPVLLGVGRLSHEKDWQTLIQAFSRVRRSLAARLVLVGEGPERRALEELVNRLGLGADVLLAGETSNPYAYMARATVLAHTSRAEGLPTVLIEALALNRPVVATDCPFGPAEILEGGKWGWLVPIGDVQATATALLEAIWRRAAPAGASASVWARFSAAAAIRAYHSLAADGRCSTGIPPSPTADDDNAPSDR